MIPCGLYLLSFLQDLSQVQAPDSDEVVATGQFMLVRRDAYDSAGGHAAVADDFYEDVALARLLKRRGASRAAAGRQQAAQRRACIPGWPTLWPGIAKNLTRHAGRPGCDAGDRRDRRPSWPGPRWLCRCWIATLRCRARTTPAWALAPALAGSAAIFGLHLAGAAYFQHPALVRAVVSARLLARRRCWRFDSLRWRMTGRVRWKGRIYP